MYEPSAGTAERLGCVVQASPQDRRAQAACVAAGRTAAGNTDLRYTYTCPTRRWGTRVRYASENLMTDQTHRREIPRTGEARAATGPPYYYPLRRREFHSWDPGGGLFTNATMYKNK